MSTVDLLPDSRTKNAGTAKGAAWSVEFNSWMVPIFCMSCGKPGGFVPERTTTFVGYLCDDPCATKYGEQAGLMQVPDQVFWRAVREEMLEQFGRDDLTLEELRLVAADGTTPLAKLINRGSV